VPYRIADEESPALPRGFSRDDTDVSIESRLYLHPIGQTATGRDKGYRLAGGSLTFDACEVIWRDGGTLRGCVASVLSIVDWATSEGAPVERHVRMVLRRLTAPRVGFAGLSLERPLIMGVVNATPDSFHDRGAFADTDAAVDQGRRLAADGAAIIDIGGESTRPGADPVPLDAELERALPVLRALSGCVPVISIDTYKAAVMDAALDAGAGIVNDVTALTGDPHSLDLVAAKGAPVILGHKRGETKTMNVAPDYACAPIDVYDELRLRVAACLAAGIDRADIAIDPGFGFGKSPTHNTRILGGLALLHGLGCPIVIGASHKAFEAAIMDMDTVPRPAPASRSLSAALAAVGRGAQILRVHDVAQMRDALARTDAEVL